MSGGGDAPAPAPTPAPLPPPTFKADDGTTFSDMDAYNAYNSNLREKTFKSQVSSALNSATDYAKTQFTNDNLGSDALDLDNLIAGYQNKANAIPDQDANPASYLSNSDVDNFLNQKQATTKNGFLDTLNSALPQSFSTDSLPLNYGSNAVGSYLDGLQGTIDQEIGNAQKRGQIDAAGLGFAQTEEARQRGVGQAHLQSIANDLATTDRANLDSQRANAFTAANNWTLGSSPIDVSGFVNNINGTAANDKSGFGDAFSAQADGYNPFDINQILLKAGIGTGPTDTQGNATAAAIASGTQKKAEPRGLGTTGAF